MMTPTTPRTRGALFMVWDGYDPRAQEALTKAIYSFIEHHPELPHEVIELPAGATLLDKSRMCDLSPFDETVFLDADTVTLGRLDYGFDKAARHGLACCICECPWARRYAGLADRGDIIEYNTGVMFFSKRVKYLFDAWQRKVHTVDSSLKFDRNGEVCVMPLNDQGGFAAAIDEVGFSPFILPLNWNYRPIWQHTVFGPIRIWHDYAPVPEYVHQWNAQQSAPDAVLNCARMRREEALV